MKSSEESQLIGRIRRIILVSVPYFACFFGVWSLAAPAYSRVICAVANVLLAHNPINGDTAEFAAKDNHISCEIRGRLECGDGGPVSFSGVVNCSNRELQFGIPVWLALIAASTVRGLRKRLHCLVIGYVIIFASQLLLLFSFAVGGKLVGIMQAGQAMDCSLTEVEMYLAGWLQGLPIQFGSVILSLGLWVILVFPHLEI